MPKLARWMAYDEVDYMLKAVANASPGISGADALRLVRWEQERCGWRGLYRTDGGAGPEDD